MRKTRLLFIGLLLFLNLGIAAYGQGEETLKIYYETEGQFIRIYADSYEIFPQSVKLELEHKGFRVNGKLQEYYVVAPNSKKMFLGELEYTGRGKTSFSYKYSIYLGDIINTVHQDDFEYTLPFRSSDSIKLTQAYNGKFSHKGKKALDFTMPEGTEIVAARSGIVIKIKEDSDVGCADKKCLEAANYLTILHSDGTHAQYFHLKKNGVVAELGQEVAQGELIGYSGNTGFTSGPHLHFEVSIPTKDIPETVSTKFLIKGKAQLLEIGSFYNSDN